jgi:hypothetical protein
MLMSSNIDNIDKNAHKNFAPNTFVERGLYVSLTTPALVGARARIDFSGRYEFLVPNMFGAKGLYVLPWKGIMESVTVTLYDRILHEEMVKQKIADPAAMRQVRLKIGATGLAGPRVQQVSKKRLEQESSYRTLTHFLLLMHILKLAGAPTADFMSGDINSEESKRKMRSTIGNIATALHINYQDLYDRLEELSGVIAPIGLAHAPEPGPLRALANGLISFQDYLKAWAEDMPTELGELAQFEAMVARQTLELANAAVAKVDGAVAALPILMKQWEKHGGAITDTITRIAWLLDGWDSPIQMCQDQDDRSPDSKRTIVVESFALLPVLPKEAAGGINSDRISMLNNIQRRWVRGNEDWRSGTLDYDRVKKIEVMKAKSL